MRRDPRSVGRRDSHRARAVLALLLLASFTLITLDLRQEGRSPIDALRGVAAAVFGPLEQAVSAVSRPVAGFVDAVGRFGEQQDEIDRLRAENERLQAELRTSGTSRRRVAELDELLGLAGAGGFSIVTAQVVAVAPEQGFARTVTIDAGKVDGVEPDMTVLTGAGLVGRVVRTGPTTATVVLAIDDASTVGARLDRTGEIGEVQGDGSAMVLTLYDQSALAVGDPVVTLGSQGGRPYVSGVPIGQVSEVLEGSGLTSRATVEPFVDFAALDVVGVVVDPPRSAPRNAMTPPPPDGE